MRMRFLPSPGITFLLLTVPAGVGCNAIAGIQEGELAAGQDASMQQDSGPGHDATMGEAGADGSSSDTSTPDAGDAGPAGEAGLLAVRCAIDTNTTVLVDDLSTYDGGADLDYIHGVWIAPTTTA